MRIEILDRIKAFASKVGLLSILAYEDTTLGLDDFGDDDLINKRAASELVSGLINPAEIQVPDGTQLIDDGNGSFVYRVDYATTYSAYGSHPKRWVETFQDPVTTLSNYVQVRCVYDGGLNLLYLDFYLPDFDETGITTQDYLLIIA